MTDWLAGTETETGTGTGRFGEVWGLGSWVWFRLRRHGVLEDDETGDDCGGDAGLVSGDREGEGLEGLESKFWSRVRVRLGFRFGSWSCPKSGTGLGRFISGGEGERDIGIARSRCRGTSRIGWWDVSVVGGKFLDVVGDVVVEEEGYVGCAVVVGGGGGGGGGGWDEEGA